MSVAVMADHHAVTEPSAYLGRRRLFALGSLWQLLLYFTQDSIHLFSPFFGRASPRRGQAFGRHLQTEDMDPPSVHFLNPQSNPQKAMSYTSSAYLGSL